MKKISLLFLSSFLAVASFSQVTFGLRVSPAISMNRVKDLNNTDNATYSNNSSGIRLAVGPTVDFKMGENYAFSTGAWYLSSRAGLSRTDERPFAFGATTKDVVSLQSVQIPLTFKAYTNEISTNLKLYFQLGGLATVNFYEKHKETMPTLINDYQNKYDFFDVALYIGAGVSYKVGESNALFAGFYYNRGLLNVLNGSADPITGSRYNKGARYNVDLAGLEVGVTF